MAWEKLLHRGTSAPARQVSREGEIAAQGHAPEARRDTRRSKRVYICMPVLIQCERGGEPYQERTTTEAVNAQGCLVRLGVALERGQKLTMVNLKSAEEVECRVVYVGRSDQGRTHAGVEFTHRAEYFWHIAFPPDDWNPADRKRPVVERPLTAKPSKSV